MPAEDSVAVVRRWFQAFNDRDFQAEADVRSTDFIAHVSGAPAPLDNAAWNQFIAGFGAGFPDFRLLVEDIIAEGNQVCVRWTFEGTHSGDFMGIPATGKKISVWALEINHVADGKVVEHWVQLDQVSLLQQLGAMPSPS